jgi:site-specific recombinase XerD
MWDRAASSSFRHKIRGFTCPFGQVAEINQVICCRNKTERSDYESLANPSPYAIRRTFQEKEFKAEVVDANCTRATSSFAAAKDYYFWTGKSKPKSAVSVYDEALRTLFDLAGTPRITPHLFRHSAATDLLTAGQSLETVAALLGHASTKVTAKHYSHWVKGRQEKLEEAVKSSWEQLGASTL